MSNTLCSPACLTSYRCWMILTYSPSVKFVCLPVGMHSSTFTAVSCVDLLTLTFDLKLNLASFRALHFLHNLIKFEVCTAFLADVMVHF